MNMRFLSFSNRIFLSVMSLFLTFAIFFMAYQNQREKEYKTSLLNMQLQSINLDCYANCPGMTDEELQHYLNLFPQRKLRLTVVKRNGNVIFDNEEHNLKQMSNHLNRKEIAQAIRNGNGFDIERLSKTLGEPFFYSATYFPQKEIIIRTAQPYDLTLVQSLKVDHTYIWVTLAITIILTFIFYKLTRHLGANIKKLREFSRRIDNEENLDDIENLNFYNDELGEISHHIVQLYQHLKESQEDKIRLKRQLTQNIAHELKTPVCSIQGYLETILEHKDSLSKENVEHFIERSHVQTERLTSLLNDISVLNRMDEASEKFEHEKVDLSEMINDIIEEENHSMASKSMVINNLVPNGIVVQGNYSLLYSIFRNLIDNSIAYAGEGTTITLRRNENCEEGFYSFTYYDNGIGVKEKHLAHLFERFYRVDKGRSRKLGGTGLGLAIVKNAVILHGGEIKAYNQAGGGLAFDFTLKA